MSHPYRQQLGEYGSRTSFDNSGQSLGIDISKIKDDIISTSSSLPRRPELFDDDEEYSSSNNVAAEDNNFDQSFNSTISSGARNMSSTSLSGNNVRKIRSKSVDLSHMYLLNGSHDTQLTFTNESVADLSHKVVSQYLSSGNNDPDTNPLVPRLKTIEMYRENVKKSKDPNVLFQYAQYMLQTALTMDPECMNSTGKDEDAAELKKKFLKDAHHYLKKLSTKGYVDAQYLLGDALASGAFGKKDNKEAYTLFQAAAKHGHVESAYRTAHCLEEGLGTTRDARKALNFLKFAASRNHPSAMYKLGVYSFYGRMGLPSDVNTKQNGIKWISRAAARANELTCAAPYELAKIYEVGFLDILIPDNKYALELYVQAATLGHVPSCTLLGQRYETGDEFLPQDTSLSVHYYTQAALKGDPVAMLGLCAWYLVGAEPAFDKDENEAFEWALRAANLKYPKAQYTLGYFYEHGKGCEKNAEIAWKWYARAAANNDKRAINKMNSKSKDDVTSTFKKGHQKSRSVNTLNLFAKMDDEPEYKPQESTFNNEFNTNSRDDLDGGRHNLSKSNDNYGSLPTPQINYFSAPNSAEQSPAISKQSANGKASNNTGRLHRSTPQNDIRVIQNTQFKSEEDHLNKELPSHSQEQNSKEKKKKKNKKDCIIM